MAIGMAILGAVVSENLDCGFLGFLSLSSFRCLYNSSSTDDTDMTLKDGIEGGIEDGVEFIDDAELDIVMRDEGRRTRFSNKISKKIIDRWIVSIINGSSRLMDVFKIMNNDENFR